MSEELLPSPCGDLCDFNITEISKDDVDLIRELGLEAEFKADPELRMSHASCGPGGGSCSAAVLTTPTAKREFHPEELRCATTSINAILSSVASHPPRKGLELSFLRVPGRGLMLAWCQHTNRKERPHKAVNGCDDRDAVLKAVGLKGGKS